MVEDYAIRIEGLGKKFSGKNQDDFWALSDVGLEIKKGRVGGREGGREGERDVSFNRLFFPYCIFSL